MSDYEKSLAELIRHERPACGHDQSTDHDLFVTAAAVYLMVRFGVYLPEGEKTVEDLEKKYEDGYAAIINDGKLLGFRDEK